MTADELIGAFGTSGVIIFMLVVALGKVWLSWTEERKRSNKLSDDRLQDAKDMADKYDATQRDTARTLESLKDVLRERRNG